LLTVVLLLASICTAFDAFQVQESLDEREPSCCGDISESEESNWHSGGMSQPEILASRPIHTTTNAGPLHVFWWLGGVMCDFMLIS